MKKIFLLCWNIWMVQYIGSVTQFRLANEYGNHMVLQRKPNQASLWGYGELGEMVFISIAGLSYSSKVDTVTAKGNTWFVKIGPFDAGGPYTLHALSKLNGTKVNVYLKDVYFGDVWLCSGQSNMGFTVSMAFNGNKEIQLADSYPKIRLLRVKRYLLNQPVDEVENINIAQKWDVASSNTVGGAAWDSFSAVCWMYGRGLFDLLKVPIGLIHAAYGGTPIEGWTRKPILGQCNITTAIGDQPQWQFEVLWNGMIHPFLTMTLYGMVWYQGETNALRPEKYDCEFPAMIKDWRAQWFKKSQGCTKQNFPVGFVQIGTLGNFSVYPPSSMDIVKNMSKGFAKIRWKQTGNYGYVPNPSLPNTFMAVTIDLPDPNSTYTPIHPRDKTDVASRLVQGAMDIAYQRNTYWTGPIVQDVFFIGVPGKAREWTCYVMFQKRSISSAGLEIRSIEGIEIMFTNIKTKNQTDWIPYSIKGHTQKYITLRVWKFDELVVTAIRYNWYQQPCAFKHCALYSDGIPAPPFIRYGPFKMYHAYLNPQR